MGCDPAALFPPKKKNLESCATKARAVAGREGTRPTTPRSSAEISKLWLEEFGLKAPVLEPFREHVDNKVQMIGFDSQALFEAVCIASCDAALFKEDRFFLAVSLHDIIDNAAKLFISRKIVPIWKECQYEGAHRVSGRIFLDGETTAVKHVAAKTRDKIVLRSFLRAAADCELIEDFFTAKKRLLALVRPCAIDQVAEKVVELLKANDAIPIDMDLVKCGQEEADEVMHRHFLRGQIDVAVTTDLDVSMARSVPRLLYLRKEGLHVQKWTPNPFLSFSRLAKSDTASFLGVGTATVRAVLSSLPTKETAQYRTEWIAARDELVRSHDETSLENQKRFAAICRKIIDAVFNNLKEKLGEKRVRVDSALTPSLSENREDMYKLLQACYMYDHLPLFGDLSARSEEEKKNFGVADVLALKQKIIKRERLKLDVAANSGNAFRAVHRLYVPICPDPVVQFVSTADDGQTRDGLAQVAAVNRLHERILSKEQKLSLRKALTLVQEQGRARGRIDDRAGVLVSDIFKLPSAKEHAERLERLKGATGSSRAAVSTSGGRKRRKLSTPSTPSFEQRHAAEFSATKLAIADHEDPVGAAIRNLNPTKPEKFFVSGVYSTHQHGWQKKTGSKTVKLQAGDALPFEPVTPLLSPFSEVTKILKASALEGGLPQLALQWFGEDAHNDVLNILHTCKGNYGNSAEELLSKWFKEWLGKWKQKTKKDLELSPTLSNHNKERKLDPLTPDQVLNTYGDRAQQVFDKIVKYRRPLKSQYKIAIAANIFFLTGERRAILVNDTSKAEAEAESEREVSEQLEDGILEPETSKETEGTATEGTKADEKKQQYCNATFRTKFNIAVDDILNDGTLRVLRDMSKCHFADVANTITRAIVSELGKGCEEAATGSVRFSLQSETLRAGGLDKLFGLPGDNTNVQIGKITKTCKHWNSMWSKSAKANRDLFEFMDRKKIGALRYGEACVCQVDGSFVLCRYHGLDNKGQTMLIIVKDEDDFFLNGLIHKKQDGHEKVVVPVPNLFRCKIQARIPPQVLVGNTFMPATEDLPHGCSPCQSYRLRKQRLGNLVASINSVLFGLVKHSSFGLKPSKARAIRFSSHASQKTQTAPTTKNGGREGHVVVYKNGELIREYSEVVSAIQEGERAYIQLGNHVNAARRIKLGITPNMWTDIFGRTRSKHYGKYAHARVEIPLHPCERSDFIDCLVEDKHSKMARMKLRFFLVPGRNRHFFLHALRARKAKPSKFVWPKKLDQNTDEFSYATADPGAPTQTMAATGATIIALDDILDGPIGKLLHQSEDIQSSIARLGSVLVPERAATRYPSREECKIATCTKSACARGKGGGLCSTHLDKLDGKHQAPEGKQVKKAPIPKINMSNASESDIKTWVETLPDIGKAFRKLNKLKRKAQSLQLRIDAKLKTFYCQYAASVAADPSFEVLFLPKLSLKSMKATRAGTKMVRQLVQHLSIAQLDDAIHSACRRSGKRVIRSKEWATSLKRPYPVTVENEKGETMQVFLVNPIGPSKFQEAESGLRVPRDYLSAIGSMPQSLGTSKARCKSVQWLKPA